MAREKARKAETTTPAVQRGSIDDLARFEELGAHAHEYLNQAKAANTRRAYRADWADFAPGCEKSPRQPFPALPAPVAYSLPDCSERLKVTTLQRRLATIAEAHRAAGHESPNRHARVRLVWQGIRREKGI